MASDPKAMVQRLWDFCDVLRDDGLSYGDYLEHLTYFVVAEDGRRAARVAQKLDSCLP